ncbi:uncharacterized protein HMPREF1541_08202 [Cyphellophora europaea CBS 101466]|uniref:Uncharacterized protein n=1 Tax=Cyphellophora europaea (strain CBS 101466) TaxID=1220924 RepID=W2RL46_CYPE1|nr:uncharacterized protein HMPREF1541_08202 [Cyphellophora europaea CBS 101466]ETN37212.1 hypothetical protein HMPREF1541_08202 [Cyphellophora europaea CBS 101466]
MRPSPTSSRHADVLSVLRHRLLRVTTGLILIWLIAVWWGERGIYKSAVAHCAWENWEQWTTQAQPHHVLLIADPQLVDPHTYPGRPWPLDRLTTLYTDLYLRRAYYNLQHALQPDSTLFLGDLFDGGREWGTGGYKSPEDRYKDYGPRFWLKEYQRFSNLFLRDWFQGPIASRSAPYGRHLIASVPGNHDLGFGSGISPQVKSRFDAYFGPLNRVDLLGNHSFVSLDTVSLSAMDEVDPKTGAHGGDASSAAATASSHLWRPVEDFLAAAKTLRHKAVQREWHRLSGAGIRRLHQPGIGSLKDETLPAEKSPAGRVPSSQFPSIILSHVPLFRPADTPCGPLREGRPSIPLSAGYQYQNVLTPLISSDIIKHLVPEEIVGIYSGDDHDYCEISHSEYTGAIKEITVKSMSWAMGIRKPGVQLLSLWNPVDLERIQQQAHNGDSQGLPTPKDTVQNQLCLLPNQLSIFLRYAQLFGFTLLILGINTLRTSSPPEPPLSKSEPLLPLSHPTPSEEDISKPRSRTSSIHPHNSAAAAETSSRKLAGYGNLPPASRSASPALPIEHATEAADPDVGADPFAPAPHTLVANVEADDWGMPKLRRRSPLPPRGRLERFAYSLWDVAWPALLCYGWFMWVDRAR